MKGRRFAYLVEFADTENLVAVEAGAVGFGVKSGQLYHKSPAGTESMLLHAGLVTEGYLPVKGATGWESSIISQNSSTIGINSTSTQAMLNITQTQNMSVVNFERIQDGSGGAAFLQRKAGGIPESLTTPTSDFAFVGGFVCQVWNGSEWVLHADVRTRTDGETTLTSTPSLIQFGTTPVGSTSLTNRMIIRQNGYMGLGIDDPTEKLHVDGNGLFTGYVKSEQLTSKYLPYQTANGLENSIIYQHTDKRIKFGESATTNPAKHLHLTGNLNFESVLPPTLSELNAMGLTAGTGTLTADTYYYNVVYYTIEGDTTSTAIHTGTSYITVGNNASVTLTNIPTSSDPRVIGRKIYRSDPSGGADEHSQYLIATIADNTTTTFVDTGLPVNLNDRTYWKTGYTAGIIYMDGAQMAAASPFMTSFGDRALRNQTTGSANVAFGYNAFGSLTEGSSGVAIGYSAAAQTTTGGNNIAIGYAATQHNNTGSNNVAIGLNALRSNVAGSNVSSNIAIGTQALYELNGAYNNNVAIGYAAGYRARANQGIYIGYAAGYQLDTDAKGGGNIVIGYAAGRYLGSGTYNLLIGNQVDLPYPNSSYQLNLLNILYGTGGSTGSSPGSSTRLGIGINNPVVSLAVGGEGRALIEASLLIGVSNSSAFTPASGISLYTAGSIISNALAGTGTRNIGVDEDGKFVEYSILPSGSTGQVQFNDNGEFAGSDNFKYSALGLEVSGTQSAVQATSLAGRAVYAVKGGTLTTHNSYDVLMVQRTYDTSYNVSGNLIYLWDTLQGAGSKSGSLIKADIGDSGSMTVLDFNARQVSGASNIAYLIGTWNDMTSGKLLAIKNSGTEEFAVMHDGAIITGSGNSKFHFQALVNATVTPNRYITAKIDGVDVRIPCWQSTEET